MNQAEEVAIKAADNALTFLIAVAISVAGSAIILTLLIALRQVIFQPMSWKDWVEVRAPSSPPPPAEPVIPEAAVPTVPAAPEPLVASSATDATVAVELVASSEPEKSMAVVAEMRSKVEAAVAEPAVVEPRGVAIPPNLSPLAKKIIDGIMADGTADAKLDVGV